MAAKRKQAKEFGEALKRWDSTGDLSNDDLRTMLKVLRVVVPYTDVLPQAYAFFKRDLRDKLDRLEDYREQRQKHKTRLDHVPQNVQNAQPPTSSEAPEEGSRTQNR